MNASTKISELNLSVDPISCQEDTPVSQARSMLQDSHVGSIVVVKDRKPVGIFTERDYLTKIAGSEAELEDQPIAEYMTENPVCIQESDRAYRAILKMREGQFRHVIITDQKDRLKSVLSVKDILDAFIDESFGTQR